MKKDKERISTLLGMLLILLHQCYHMSPFTKTNKTTKSKEKKKQRMKSQTGPGLSSFRLYFITKYIIQN